MRSEEPTNHAPGAEFLDMARHLAAAGRSLEASLYFEAALSAGGAPEEILPDLWLAQARAGRLREALRRIDQFLELRPMDADLEELRRILKGLLVCERAVP
jgi:Flp pilus assembly protein TadD